MCKSLWEWLDWQNKRTFGLKECRLRAMEKRQRQINSLLQHPVYDPNTQKI